MIKSGNFKNAFGIKELSIDFGVTHSYGKGQDEQVINVDGESISLIPTILAKNAAGKTSLIKAIQFALRFASEYEFKRNIHVFAMGIAFDAIKEQAHNNMLNNSFDTGEFLIQLPSKKIIKRLFNEVSFAGSELMSVELELTGNRIIKIELTNDSFYVVLNNETINIGSFLDDIKMLDPKTNTMNDFSKSIVNQIDVLAEDLEFYSKHAMSSAIFRDTMPKTQMGEMIIKDITEKYIRSLTKTLGSDAIIIILKKLDPNITNIKQDNETKTIDVYIKNSDNPISARNLSFGTQKVIEILYKSMPLFRGGGVMMIDEIENGLHLSLIKLITSIFEDEEINIAKAQLLMSTHNPLISEREIVKPFNLFMEDSLSFVSLKKIKFSNNKRTYNQVQLSKAKNYYNDLFWEANGSSSKSTISNLAINQIIDAIQTGVECQR